MPRLSIIIPWWDGLSAAFEDTLVSVLQNRPYRCEIIVVHAQPYDDPYKLAGEVRFLAAPGADEIEMINAGVALAESGIVHVLRCGVEVQDGWVDAAVSGFRDPLVACVTPVIEQRGDRSRIAAAGVGYRAGGTRRVCGVGQRVERWCEGGQFDEVLAPSLAAGFYRREVLLALGGFDAAVGAGAADVDFGLALASVSLRCAVAPGSRLIGDIEGPRARGYRAGCQAQRLFWRHLAHRGWTRSLLEHPLAVVGSCVAGRSLRTGLAELAGRIRASLEIGSQRRYRTRLASLVLPTVTPTMRIPAAATTMRRAA